MDTLQQLKDEFTQEYKITKKFIDHFPQGNNDYAPHEKSMKLMPLATHIAEIFAWPQLILNTEILDFAAGDYKPTILNTGADLQQKFEESYRAGINALDAVEEEKLNGKWALANDGHTLAEWTKYGSIRHALNQICLLYTSPSPRD